jgi:hypothetical protein
MSTHCGENSNVKMAPGYLVCIILSLEPSSLKGVSEKIAETDSSQCSIHIMSLLYLL